MRVGGENLAFYLHGQKLTQSILDLGRHSLYQTIRLQELNPFLCSPFLHPQASAEDSKKKRFSGEQFLCIKIQFGAIVTILIPIDSA